MKHLLVLPLAFYAFFLWALAISVFRARSKCVKSGEVSPKYFRAYTGEGPPEPVVILAQHYDNQFQVPMLFFATGAVAIALDSVNALTLALAWAFVASRLAHSWIHLGKNHVLHRALSFAVGWFLILALWVQLAYFAVT